MTKITNFVWNPVDDCIISEVDETGAVQAIYTNEPQQYGGVISQRQGTTTSTYHYDALGSTRFLTDSSGNVTDTYLNDAWGNQVASSGTTVNPFKWVGKYGYYTDNSTEQVYVRARMYQPTVARWMSVDPLFHELLRYKYGRLNPVLMMDPSGWRSFTSIWSRPGDDEERTYETALIALTVDSDASNCDDGNGCGGNVTFSFHYHAKIGGIVYSPVPASFGLCIGNPYPTFHKLDWTSHIREPLRDNDGYQFWGELKLTVPLLSLPCCGGTTGQRIYVTQKGACEQLHAPDGPIHGPHGENDPRLAEEIQIRQFVKECGDTFATTSLQENPLAGEFPHSLRCVSCGEPRHPRPDEYPERPSPKR
jgi:RHS repeat-associated protein